MIKQLLILVVFLRQDRVANVLEEDDDPNLFEDSLSFHSSKHVLQSVYYNFVQQQQGGFIGYLSPHSGVVPPRSGGQSEKLAQIASRESMYCHRENSLKSLLRPTFDIKVAPVQFADVGGFCSLFTLQPCSPMRNLHE
jgi:hypothetical protein